MNIIKGDLIKLALNGEFDVIAHGVNCFCKQSSGIAKGMVKYFDTTNTTYYTYESGAHLGAYNKLGQIQSAVAIIWTDDGGEMPINVVNCYTQYRYGRNHADGDNDPYNKFAIALCLQKLNHEFSGKHIGLPYIGCGLASPPELRKRRKDLFEGMIELLMSDCEVTLVEYER